ncbi:hypothetical protein Q6A26_11360 [Xanthomonas euvesicatoria pv. eucalypti]|uniref:hypothetical protein n=1 Tax=Xanthomonas euvesicatoria TaxID=456327 RepID=UPI0026E29D60|nr:hypothetical protein [Xanthomonas euvesicatoria]MDO7932285.1 hypothetical protein [Xanthomonas euvesicatoria pv. eucalypti]MDO7937672.1 hypothetical protein [Xanthomonas euvesicatoria pv. eucalypti]MDO7940653.1 hypothetical protein [Xanthomonas euvesicatoria pv. eucalypti]MDO7945205.1 hypothetical protein [Xanthomonas euvesicatoria pv. eucalypti]MDO7949976.1 hypothetical protein [Xanthomonas euvesicatoria pv. eucalypti]
MNDYNSINQVANVSPHSEGLRSGFSMRQLTWWVFFCAFGILTWLTFRWRIPILLWDHLDIVPIYQAWQDGHLGNSDFWKVHDGSHLHTAAYAILLLTTWLSEGQTWLDCLVSSLILAVCSFFIVRMALRDFGARLSVGWMYGFVLLALYPGHLINLQWGWQVAVFVSLLGVVAPVYLLTNGVISWPANFGAVACATVGVLGFSTALAVFPVAIWLLIRRVGFPVGRRLTMCLPWLISVMWLVMLLHDGHAGEFAANPGVFVISRYVLNYLGSGVMHFSNELAPFFAVLAIMLTLWAVVRVRLRANLVPWLSLMVVATGFAIMTAWGRAALFGPEHGFMPRYASFSILFWIGWLGVMLAAFRDESQWRWVRPLLLFCLCAAAFNGLHLAKKSMKVAERSRQIAVQVRREYPKIDQKVLLEAYDWRAKFAEDRLRTWYSYGYAPFEEATPSNR